MSAPELRDYQTKNIADIEAKIAAGNRRILNVLATGGGQDD